MERINVAERITDRIKMLDELKDSLPLLAEQKNQKEANYEKQLALVIIGLRNGKEFDIDGEAVSNIPTTLIEKSAKGICWAVKLEMDRADSQYKNALKIIDLTEAQLNGYQSINRHLSEV